MTKLKVLDYKGEETDVDIECALDDIFIISITVLTGDEIMSIIYKDGSKETIDSSMERWENCYDCEYDVYNPGQGINLLENERFMNRTNSYWYDYA